MENLSRRPKGLELFDGDSMPSDMRAVLELQRLVELHFRSEHGAEFYVGGLGYTVKRMNALTVAYFGLTVHGLVQERIHAEACRLLVHSRMTVKEITYWLGVSDSSWFCRCFRRKEGLSPLAFRSRYGK